MDYNRLVAYIYSYVEGKKGANAGFARIEVRNERVKFKISMKNIYSILEVALVYEENGQYRLIDIGKAQFRGDNGEFNYEGNCEDIEASGISFDQIKGIFMRGEHPEKIFYASEWEDKGITFPIELKASAVTEPEPVIEVPVNMTKWEEIIFDREKIHIFADDDFMDVVEITPDDIEKMPNTNWHLLRNSFVKYGYQTFRHLIAGKINDNGTGRYFIGIPGIYNRRERATAGLYGFTYFKFSMRSDIRLSQFGYWYKDIQL